ncbi:MAG: pentapeptide repeat-containing protein [Pirellulales bacterium]
MNRLVASLLILLCANDLVAPASAWQITIDTVPVGNPGNVPDPADGDFDTPGTQHFGSVDYDYRIGKYEVTNAQYAAFLNAKAKSDPLGLYYPFMGSIQSNGGITQNGTDGSYVYATIPGRENMPVNWVSWHDAIRFANWLNNGQGDGDTESGAYTIRAGIYSDRNPGATWFVPNEDEWYKAAYYNPDTSSYFVFPTSSNTPPTAEAPAGGSNSANYNFAQGFPGDLTSVGAYTGATSPYGAFDMGGNVQEWIQETQFTGAWPHWRGGSFMDGSGGLQSSSRVYMLPSNQISIAGFRVATIPEPSTLALAGIGLVAVLSGGFVRRRRGFPRGSTVGLVAFIACLVLLFGNVRVANAQFAQLTDRVEIYDTSTGLWSTDELSLARCITAATSAGGKAIFAGGGGSLPFVSDRVDLFDASTGQWSTASLSQPRTALTATSVGDLALFGGGYDAAGQGSSRVDIYDAKNDQWTQSSLSVPRDFAAATTVGNRVLFGGGSADAGHNSPSDAVDMYDASSGQWSVAHLSQARDMLAATTVGALAFFAGGYNSQSGSSDVVDIYDSNTDQWSVAHLSEARGLFVAAAVGNKALFAGGATASGTASAVVDIYDTDTGQWSVASLSQARWFLASATIDNKAYFAGGTATDDGTTGFDTVDIYDGNTGLWSVDHLPVDHEIHGGTAVGDLVLFGGGYTLGVPEPSSIELTAAALLGLIGFVGVRRRRGFANRLGVGLLSWCACLGLMLSEGQVATAQSQLTTRVDIYNTSADVWSTAELSQARVIAAATSAGGKALFAGGDLVDVFDASKEQWSTASLSQSRQALTATSVGDLALFAGGYDALLQGSSCVDIYDAKNDQWSQSSLSAPRDFAAATTVGNRALFGGGSADASHNSASDVVDIYDAATGQWSLAHLSQARDMLAATTAGGKAFFAGGYNQEKGMSDVVDIYDSTTDQWSVAHLSEPRAQLVAATVGSKAIFSGGANDPSGIASAVVDIFDTDTGQWSVASLSQARFVLAAAAVDNKAYFAGGASSGSGSPSYDIVDVYDGTTGLWTVDHLSQDHHYLGGTAVGDLVLFGGGYVPEPASIELAAVALLGLLSFAGVRRWRRQKPALLAALAFAMLLASMTTARADIFRWDNQELIPGTEGITLGPGVQLSNWNTGGHNLRFADFSGGLDLNQANFHESWLDDARFTGANLAGAALGRTSILGGEGPSSLTNAGLSGANLSGATLWESTLIGADLTEAVVVGAVFDDTTNRGFTHAQLASTASYRAKDLHGIVLRANDLTGWDFSGQDLTGAGFGSREDRSRFEFLDPSTLTNANLGDAVVKGADFRGTTSAGLTLAQLASTASYKAKDLQGIGLADNNLTDWDFSGQNLTGAVFVWIGDGPSVPFRGGSTLTNANLSGATLTGANLHRTTLTGANLNDAVVVGANFPGTHGFTQAQLASTASYKAKDLHGINLASNDLTGWDFSGQNLTGAQFGYYGIEGDQLPTLTDANFSGANLTGASFGGATLTNANFNGAVVTGTIFDDTTSRGFTQQQLSSTQSYQDKNLTGIGLSRNDFTGWDFSGQNLSNANLDSATLTNANMSFADMRGARFLPDTSGVASLRDSILPEGVVNALDLNAGERLVVRDDDGVSAPLPQWWLTPRSPIPVTVQDDLTMAVGGTLELRFDSDPWNSLISFAPGIPVRLGGTLDLSFAKDTDAAAQVGHSLHVFDWTGVSPTGQFTVSSLYDWDTSGLYTTGVVTLLSAGGVIAGDADGNGKVEMEDFDILKTHFGDLGSKSNGDANGDGRIDLNDFGLLKLNFGKSAAAVPEPSSAFLAVLAVLGFAGVRRWRRQTPALLAALGFATLVASVTTAHADIFRWDNSQVIPGTEGITPGPGVQLDQWNTEAHNLRYADFVGGLDLHQSSFRGSWLDNARFSNANLSNGDFGPFSNSPAEFGATLTGANLSGANLTNANFAGSTLTNANLTGANLTNGYFGPRNSEPAEVGATLTGANLSGANLTNANFASSTLTNANLANANLTNGYFGRHSTYPGVIGATLTGADLSGANLAGADLSFSTLAAANLSEALVRGANFGNSVSRGFSQAQLASTASYQVKDLQGINLAGNDLSGWDFSGQNLSGAGFFREGNFRNPWEGVSALTNANLNGANLTGADLTFVGLGGATLSAAVVTEANLSATGITQSQLASTTDYQAKDLRGINLSGNDMKGWNLSGQNLSGARLGGHVDPILYGFDANLTNADLSGAYVTGADFTGSRGLIQAQLASTASYQANDLHGIRLGSINMTGWDFNGQNLAGASFEKWCCFFLETIPTTLTGANFSGANLANANLSGALVTGANFAMADTRGAQGLDLTGAISHNTILPDGKIAGLDLAIGEQLVVRNSPIAVSVQDHLKMTDGAALELRFDSDPWSSVISFQPGTPVDFGGKLELTFAKGADAAPQVGHTLHVFDWSGVSPTGAFTVSSPYDWETSALYTTGVVTLLAAVGVIAGDADGNGKVDLTDFGILKTHFGAPGAKAEGDANGDGRIDLNDFGLLKANFGKNAVPVPEPATLILAALGLALIHVRRSLGGSS